MSVLSNAAAACGTSRRPAPTAEAAPASTMSTVAPDMSTAAPDTSVFAPRRVRVRVTGTRSRAPVAVATFITGNVRGAAPAPSTKTKRKRKRAAKPGLPKATQTRASNSWRVRVPAQVGVPLTFPDNTPSMHWCTPRRPCPKHTLAVVMPRDMFWRHPPPCPKHMIKHSLSLKNHRHLPGNMLRDITHP